jgi:hypothetical protein
MRSDRHHHFTFYIVNFTFCGLNIQCKTTNVNVLTEPTGIGGGARPFIPYSSSQSLKSNEEYKHDCHQNKKDKHLKRWNRVCVGYSKNQLDKILEDIH